MALVSAVVKQAWGAGGRRSCCCQEEAGVTPAVTRVPPGKVHALPSPPASPYNARIMCPVFFLTGPPPAFTGPQWLGVPQNVTGVAQGEEARLSRARTAAAT